jgi:hypothetical protein
LAVHEVEGRMTEERQRERQGKRVNDLIREEAVK